jgi:hypothetical protein
MAIAECSRRNKPRPSPASLPQMLNPAPNLFTDARSRLLRPASAGLFPHPPSRESHAETRAAEENHNARRRRSRPPPNSDAADFGGAVGTPVRTRRSGAHQPSTHCSFCRRIRQCECSMLLLRTGRSSASEPVQCRSLTESSHGLDAGEGAAAAARGQKQARCAGQSKAEAIIDPGDCFSYSGSALSVIAMATRRSPRSRSFRPAARYRNRPKGAATRRTDW